MAIRNLTKKFVEFRNGSKANKNLRIRQDSRDGSDNGLLNVRQRSGFIFPITMNNSNSIIYRTEAKLPIGKR
jgi:hypothetical protein